MAGVRIGVENGLYATFYLKVKLIFFTNLLVLREVDLPDLFCQIYGVVSLRAREGTEGVKGLHE